MTLADYLKNIDCTVLTPEVKPETIEVEGGYVSDLLSDVMGAAGTKQAWITIMRHLNVVAVASLAGINAVIFAKGIKPDQTVIDKATAEGVCLVSSPETTFDLAGKLYKLLN